MSLILCVFGLGAWVGIFPQRKVRMRLTKKPHFLGDGLTAGGERQRNRPLITPKVKLPQVCTTLRLISPTEPYGGFMWYVCLCLASAVNVQYYPNMDALATLALFCG